MASIDVRSAYVTSQPVVINPFHQHTDEWRVGLCDCCTDCKQCCYAFLCCWCFTCSLATTINESCISCFCVPNVLTVYRTKIRAAYNIRGDSCNDCCVVTWCPCCAELQMRNELTVRGLR